MNEQLKRLIALQEVDAKIFSVNRVIDSFPSKIAEIELPFRESQDAFDHIEKVTDPSLFQGHADTIAHRLRQQSQGKACRNELLQEAGYFKHNQHCMDYQEMRMHGWVIGSGMVESGASNSKHA